MNSQANSVSCADSFTSTIAQRAIPEMGTHLILDFCDIQTVDMDDFEGLDRLLTKIIIDSGATIEGRQHKKFEPQGVTILYLLSESHFSIHTWPENRACAIDFYHCGTTAERRLKKAEELLCDALGWDACTASMLVSRGNRTQYLLNNYSNYATIFKNINMLERQKSNYQDIRVYESPDYGKIYALDNMIQSAEYMNDTYVMDITDPVIDPSKDLEEVLIIGGSDLHILSYLLSSFPKIQKITVAEIDEAALEVAKKHLLKTFTNSDRLKRALEDGTINIEITDGAEFIANSIQCNRKFDAIIMDNTDNFFEHSISRSLYKLEFYKNVYKVLKSGAAFSQMIGTNENKLSFENLVRKANFREITVRFCLTPLYGVSIPLGIARKV